MGMYTVKSAERLAGALESLANVVAILTISSTTFLLGDALRKLAMAYGYQQAGIAGLTCAGGLLGFLLGYYSFRLFTLPLKALAQVVVRLAEIERNTRNGNADQPMVPQSSPLEKIAP